MAHEDEGWGGAGGRFYNVDHSVGQGGANYMDDVMLVQYYLKKIYADPMFYDAPEPGTLAVDGKCGPITRRWILAFQRDMQKNDIPPFRVRTDGRVDPAPSPVGEDSFHTIALLNRQHGKAYPDDDVRNSPEAPPYLRKSLSKSIYTYGGGI